MWKSKAQKQFEADREANAQRWEARAKKSKAEARKYEAMVAARHEARRRGRSNPNLDDYFCEKSAATTARGYRWDAKYSARRAADERRSRRGMWR